MLGFRHTRFLVCAKLPPCLPVLSTSARPIQPIQGLNALDDESCNDNLLLSPSTKKHADKDEAARQSDLLAPVGLSSIRNWAPTLHQERPPSGICSSPSVLSRSHAHVWAQAELNTNTISRMPTLAQRRASHRTELAKHNEAPLGAVCKHVRSGR